MIYMFLSNNPSSGDINSSNLSCFHYFVAWEAWSTLMDHISVVILIVTLSVFKQSSDRPGKVLEFEKSAFCPEIGKIILEKYKIRVLSDCENRRKPNENR